MSKLLQIKTTMFIFTTTCFFGIGFTMVYSIIINNNISYFLQYTNYIKNNINKQITELNEKLDKILIYQLRIIELLDVKDESNLDVKDVKDVSKLDVKDVSKLDVKDVSKDSEYLDDCYDNIPANKKINYIYKFW